MPGGEQDKVGNAVLEEGVRRAVEAGFPESRIQTRLKIDSIDPAQDILAEMGTGQYRSVALGRRGRSRLEQLLLGSVSSKVAEYGSHHPVCIVDCPVRQTGRVLVAMENERESQELADYAADVLALVPGLRFTFLHLMPPVPPTFWDDGHILESEELKDRQARIDKWRSDWIQRVEYFMDEARGKLVGRGVPDSKIDSLILPVREGIARDLLNEIDAHEFQVVIMGKKSFRQRKPFLMGSHASKVLYNVSGVVLCLVDS
ncbi:MAG: universal stress protein [Desulfobacteraceae bacterium]|nr:universal stress protein [Desulfobacteraceae bacterium]